MKLLSPTQHQRLNEVTGFLLLSLGLVMLLSLVSYHVQDPSWDTASSARPLNLVGYPGSYLSDLCFQVFGATALLFPFLIFALAWKWIRSDEVRAGAVKVIGSVLLTLSLCAALSFAPWRMFAGNIPLGGTLGYIVLTRLVDSLNVAGAIVATATTVIVAVYLVSTFALAKLVAWFAVPAAWLRRRRNAWWAWRDEMWERSLEKARECERKRMDTAQATRRLKKRTRLQRRRRKRRRLAPPRPTMPRRGRRPGSRKRTGMPKSMRSPSARWKICRRCLPRCPSRQWFRPHRRRALSCSSCPPPNY
jgi:S-DNA-T family DNA segregation ATPase FtsK/SpoIIIE